MFNNLMIILSLLIMTLGNLVPSDPNELEHELRKIVEPTIATANFILEPLINYSIVPKDPHQKPNGAKYSSKYVHSSVQPNY